MCWSGAGRACTLSGRQWQATFTGVRALIRIHGTSAAIGGYFVGTWVEVLLWHFLPPLLRLPQR